MIKTKEQELFDRLVYTLREILSLQEEVKQIISDATDKHEIGKAVVKRIRKLAVARVGCKDDALLAETQALLDTAEQLDLFGGDQAKAA